MLPAPTANSAAGEYSVGINVGSLHPDYFLLTNLAAGLVLTPIANSTPQATIAGYGFGIPPTVTVTDTEGHIAPGVVVTFTAPASAPAARSPAASPPTA